MLLSVNIILFIFEEGKKIKFLFFVYVVLLYFIEELNGGHIEVDIGSLFGN